MYPTIKAGWTLFHHPAGAYLKSDSAGGLHLTGDIWHLSSLAVETLLLCDGRMPVEDILRRIQQTCAGEGFSAAESSASFLAEAMEKGIIEILPEPNGRTIVQKGSKERFLPLHFAIELTDSCNLTCRHCYRVAGPESSQYLPTEALLKLLERFAAYGVQSLELSGGEPTRHPDFPEILEFSVQHFGAVALLTNGTLLSAPVYDILQRNRATAIVQVDLDGCTAEEHDWLRGAGAFHRAAAALGELASRSVRVRVAMSLHRGNIGSIEKTYLLAKKLGATWFTCSPVMAVGRADKELLLTWEEVKAAVERLNALTALDPDTVLNSAELKRLAREDTSNCGAGSRSIAIGPDGSMRPCFLVNKRLAGFGNLLQESLEAALEHAPLAFFRNLEAPCPEVCGDCAYTVFCYGCVARPLIAWDWARKESKAFRCRWSEQTGYAEQVGIQSPVFQ